MELCPLDLSVAQTILTLSTQFFYFYWADVESFLKIRTKYKPGSTIVPANSFQKWQIFVGKLYYVLLTFKII